MKHKSYTQAKKWILLGIPLLFIIGSIFHFLYDIFWESPVIGLIAPVNESIWEHSKLVLWPVILWWSLYYGFRGKRDQLDKRKWFSGALTALVVSLAAMPLLYYFYTGAFGVELLWVDILILLLAVLCGQLLGLHAYRRGTGIDPKYSLIVFSVLVLLFMVLTFLPPQMPLFRDNAI